MWHRYVTKRLHNGHNLNFFIILFYIFATTKISHADLMVKQQSEIKVNGSLKYRGIKQIKAIDYNT